MMSLKYDDIEPTDEDEASEYDSIFESFRWPPCLEIEEIDQGWIRFSRTSSSQSSISSLLLNKSHVYPQPRRPNWMKRLFGSSGIVDKSNLITPSNTFDDPMETVTVGEWGAVKNGSGIVDCGSSGIVGKPNPITPVVEQLNPSNTFDDPMETVTMGEWGALKHGSDERSFDHRGYDGIKRIIIYYGQLIDSITIQYTKQGALEWTEKIRENGGEHRREIVLDDSDEYITQVTGWYNKNREGISQLTFISNRKTHGPFGKKEAPWVDEYEKYENEYLSVSIPFGYSGGKLVGFKGAAGRYLSSIGFHVSYLPYSCENDGNKCIMSTASTIQHVPNISQAPCRFHQIYVDMFGYPSRGIPFQHGEYDGIKRIFIGHGIKWINFFLVEYMKSGQPQLSQGVGQRGGSSTSTEIVLDHPREFLQTVKGNYVTDKEGQQFEFLETVKGNYVTDEEGQQFELSGDKIVGFHDEVINFEGVTSLTFYSNVRKYGPFGYERGQQFEASGGKIVSFQGTADEYGLRAIGFYIVPTNSLQEL